MPVIQLVAFRGTGGVFNPDSPHYAEPPLVRTGHVGLQGVLPGRIIGFSPTPAAAAALGGTEALLLALQHHQPQPGQLQDDTAAFQRAYELTPVTDGRTTVYVLDVEISEQTLTDLLTWYNEKRTALYNLPDAQPPEFGADEDNCATFPRRLNVPIPVNTGKLQKYIAVMQLRGARLWQPSSLTP